MTVVGLDDTDSRDGMCTTYLGAEIADRLSTEGRVERLLLLRCNPAVEHKTRGNAAVAVHADADPEVAFSVARGAIEEFAETDDPSTNPGLVVAPGSPEEVPDAVAEFAREAVRDHHEIAEAERLIAESDYLQAGWGLGRGRIGALAAVGAWAAFEGWTVERISYREPGRWGTERVVDHDSIFAAADAAYPDAWDTVDRGTGDAVCVPNTPCPILHGIRGDDEATVRAVSGGIESEPVHRTATFLTNQGTDAHLRDAEIPAVEEGRAYCVPGTVVEAPETRRGGHVYFAIADGVSGPRSDGPRDERLPCVAFEPTKRFRDRVRDLRVGDRIVACGEVADGHLKLEKFAVRDLDRTERVVPTCPDCGRSMESAGADQGYRCRDCETSRPGKVEQRVDRDLEGGWYEVPPSARRHIAKPLVRGGFDASTHPEQ
jgi:tRNA(Ile2)-agmatinylcytidine synthase